MVELSRSWEVLHGTGVTVILRGTEMNPRRKEDTQVRFSSLTPSQCLARKPHRIS